MFVDQFAALVRLLEVLVDDGRGALEDLRMRMALQMLDTGRNPNEIARQRIAGE